MLGVNGGVFLMRWWNSIRMNEAATHYAVFAAIFFVYLALRVVAWNNTPVLEDHDSVGYLNNVRIFLTFDPKQVANISPVSTPFYPFCSGLWSLLAGSPETGARLCSLSFSCLLFVAIAGIGRRIAKPLEVSIGLAIVVFSPVLIRLSYAVLSEPSYIGMIYLGFWLFMREYEDPRLWSGALLGIIVGLCFLNRLEGILYAASIPVLQLIHYMVTQERRYSLKRLSMWTTLFFFAFMLVAVPQVWRVSEQMGSFALNGRQAWSLIMNSPDGRSYEQKIYGLQYDPGQINIEYLVRHPEARRELVSDAGLVANAISYLKLALVNLDTLNQERLGQLIGSFGMLFFAFGLLALSQSRQRFEVFLLLAFICIGLVAPLLHNVDLRHIAVIAPLIMVVEGIGIVFMSRAILRVMART